ncbi:MAG: hypothetical protein JRG89_13810 [Deltaproteobacteria bacterium]|nr:hypothetical protein [Deltaproteobacteria bacterium]
MKIMLLITAGLALALFVSCESASFMSREFETMTRAEAPSDPETRFVEAIEAFVGDTPISGQTTGDEAGKQNESIDL